MMRGQHFSLHYLQCFCNPSTTSRTLPPFSHSFFFFFQERARRCSLLATSHEVNSWLHHFLDVSVAVHGCASLSLGGDTQHSAQHSLLPTPLTEPYLDSEYFMLSIQSGSDQISTKISHGWSEDLGMFHTSDPGLEFNPIRANPPSVLEWNVKNFSKVSPCIP